MLITEKPGKMRILTTNGEAGAPIANVPAVLYKSDGGLLDLVIDPKFAKNRQVYFAYAEPRDGGQGLTLGGANSARTRPRSKTCASCCASSPLMPACRISAAGCCSTAGQVVHDVGRTHGSRAARAGPAARLAAGQTTAPEHRWQRGAGQSVREDRGCAARHLDLRSPQFAGTGLSPRDARALVDRTWSGGWR